jgi:hypothetical protein
MYKPDMPEKTAGTREVLDVVFDLLSTDVPEEKIISMLLQMGLKESEAKAVISAAKAKLEKYLESRLATSVDKLLETRKKEIEQYVASELEDTKRKIALQTDMRLMEQKKYTDDQTTKLRAEIEALKSDVFSFKTEAGSQVKQAVKQTELLGLKTLPRLVSIGVVFGGLFACLASFILIKGIVDMYAPGIKAPALSDIIPQLLLYSILFVIGIVVLKAGIDMYSLQKVQKGK